MRWCARSSWIAAAQLGQYGDAAQAFGRAGTPNTRSISPRMNLGSVSYLREDYLPALEDCYALAAREERSVVEEYSYLSSVPSDGSARAYNLKKRWMRRTKASR